MSQSLALLGMGKADTLQQRIVLYQNELYRVPASYRSVRVVSGVALVTQAAKDMVLGPGHEATLTPGQDVALVSALRGDQVIVELYGPNHG